MRLPKMIFILGALLTYVSLPACKNRNDTNDETDIEKVDSTYTDTTIRYFDNPDSNFVVLGVDTNLLWTVDVPRKTLKKPKSSLTPLLGVVIGALNTQYPDIQLTNPVLKNDTLMLKIPKSDYFTNQIGSTGAAQYLAQAIINLTSVPGIKYVKIDFEMGSHASPGVWSRADFPGYIIVQ